MAIIDQIISYLLVHTLLNSGNLAIIRVCYELLPTQMHEKQCSHQEIGYLLVYLLLFLYVNGLF